jgi:translation elongation factor EF-1alpha
MSNKKFCFVGHVDAGKSTIAGHLYVKCGGLSDHEFAKIKKDSEKKKYQLWSRVLDIWEEEQEKGKTHEFNLLKLNYNNKEYDLIDTPGHKMFIRSLIEGISHFENSEITGCLVISMAKGEFESGWENGQTKEDIIIARSIGIRSLIVLFNKMDTTGWSEKAYETVKKKIRPFIHGCNFSLVEYIPISGYDGVGLTDKEGLPKWYNGFTLMEFMEKIDLKPVAVPPIDLDSWTEMVCEVKILATDNIITCGYTCIMHFDGGEYDVTLEKLKSKKFLKRGDSDTIIIKSDVPINKNRGTRRIILRDKTFTVGFGRILKVR